jgi:hypothetical protein
MALPEGLQFLKIGWWVAHVLFTVLVYSYGYRKGRAEERKARGVQPQVANPSRTS